MTSIKKVLLPTDLSPQSRNLASCTGDLNRMGVEEVTVLYSLKPGLVLKDAGIALLSSMVDELRAAGIEADFEILAGDNAVLDILAFAVERDCDMIMMASSGKGRAKEFLVGSTSKGVMRRSDIPVLLKRYHVSAGSVTAPCELIFSKVLAVVNTQADESAYRGSLQGILEGMAADIRIYDTATGRMGPWQQGDSMDSSIGRLLVEGERHASVMKALGVMSGTLVVLPRKGKGSVDRLLRNGSEGSINDSEASILVIPE